MSCSQEPAINDRVETYLREEQVYFMNPSEDPWQKKACENAERLEKEIGHLLELIVPIREKRPLITKYQDFWNHARQIFDLFRTLKPITQEDRDRLWKQFSDFCAEVKESQRSEYGTLESLSKGHYDELMEHADAASIPPGKEFPDLEKLMERGYSLKITADLLGKYKHEMIAHHKKRCFQHIQQRRKALDTAWEMFASEKIRHDTGRVSTLRKNIEKNYERYRKASGARDHFQNIVDELRGKISTVWNEEWRADAIRRVVETERRIHEIDEGKRRLELWIAEDERTLRG